MNKICTSLEQSKKLLELGIDVNTADMDYIPCVNDMSTYSCVINEWNNEHEENWIPAWTLSALLEVIRNNGRYELEMYEGGYFFEANGFMTESYFNPVDACVEMIVKLHEQKFL